MKPILDPENRYISSLTKKNPIPRKIPRSETVSLCVPTKNPTAQSTRIVAHTSMSIEP